MIPYRLCTLYSGSTGNAAYLETPGARILIDAGRCARTLCASLRSIGVDVDTLDAIFITHEHMDHVASLEVLAKKHPIPVHMLYESARRYESNPPEALCRCFALKKNAPFTVTVGDVTVTAFPTPHDSRASVGYRFTVTDGEESLSIGYATDIGHVSTEVREGLMGCETVVLESNHDVDMLMDGPYPYDLKLRIRGKRGHLSNRECADLCAHLAEGGATRFLLAHLSEENNHPDVAFDETFSTLAGLPVTVAVASPTEVTMVAGDPCRPLPLPRKAVSL